MLYQSPAALSVADAASRLRAQPAQVQTKHRDPIFAAIAAHDRACASIMAYCDRGEDIPRTATHHKELRALSRTSPHTPEGVRALGAHIAKWWPEFFSDIALPEIRQAFQSLAKAMPSPRGTQSTKPDPVFALIQKFETAFRAFERIVDEEARLEKKLGRHEARIPQLMNRDPDFKLSNPPICVRDEAELEAWGKAQAALDYTPMLPKGRYRVLVGNTVKAAKKELRAARSALRREQDKHGVTAHFRRYNATNEAAENALRKVVTTIPTTAAGLCALSAFAAKNCRDHLDGQRWDATELCFATIAKAAQRLGGQS